MTLWVFGDSYSRYFKSQSDTWVNRTGNILETDVMAYSRPLEPMEHIFYKFNQNRNRIQQNDIIIFTITQQIRRWFWKDQIFKVYYEYTEEETLAVNNFDSYLNHFHDVHFTFLTNFMFNLHYITSKLNLHTIILASLRDQELFFQNIDKKFPLFHFAQGTISEVSDYEWESNILIDRLNNSEYREKKDKRLNHLCRVNHIIMSDKIIDNIKNKNVINLRKDFKTNFINYELENDVNFRQTELFNDEWVNTVNSDEWKRDIE